MNADLDGVPGPVLPRISSARYFAGWFSFLRRCHGRYGDVFRLHLPVWGPVVVIADPDAVRALHVEKDLAVTHVARAAIVRELFDGQPLGILDGREHLLRRRAVLPLLSGEGLRAWEEPIAEVVREHVERLQPAVRTRMGDWAPSLTTAVTARLLLGIEDAGTARRFEHLLRAHVAAWTAVAFLPASLRSTRGPGPWRRFLTARRELRALFLERIEALRGGDPRTSVAAALDAAVRRDGGRVSTRQLYSEVLELALAGSHTTGLALAWSLDCLLHEPTVRDRFQATPDDDELADAIVQETLRVCPIVDAGPRRITRAIELSGHRVAPERAVYPSAYLVHHRADLYERPDEFRPSRFLDARPTTYGWLPFGGGAHRMPRARARSTGAADRAPRVVHALARDPADGGGRATTALELLLGPRRRRSGHRHRPVGMSTHAAQRITIATPWVYCPIPSAIHPRVDRLEQRGVEWMRRFGFCDERVAQRRVVGSRAAEFAARMAPDAPDEMLQLATDWSYLMFVFDDQCDAERERPDARSILDFAVRMLRTLEAPSAALVDAHPIGPAFTELARRAHALATPTQLVRCAEAHRQWVLGLAWEMATRRQHWSLDLNDYVMMRLYGCAGPPVTALIALMSDGEVPGAELDQPRVRALTELSWIIAASDNDLVSYGKELWSVNNAQASPGERPLNLLEVLMRSRGCELAEALRIAVNLRNDFMTLFVALREETAGVMSRPLQQYLANLGHLIRGNYDWSLTSERYRDPDGASPNAVEFSGGVDAVSDAPVRRMRLPAISWWWDQLARPPARTSTYPASVVTA